MKKALAITLVIMMVPALLGGCSGAPASSSSPAAPSSSGPAGDVSLRAMWWGSQARHDATISVIEMYEKENPGTTISYEFMGYDDYWQKLNTLIAANDPPDIIQMGNNFLTYKKQIEPLDAYVADGTIDTTNIADSFLSPTTINGELLGISLGTNAHAMIYDPQLFAQTGVKEPDENWTWDDLKQACFTINKKLGIYGTGDINYFWSIAIYVMQHGTEYSIFNKDGTALGYDDPAMAEGYFQLKRDLLDVPGVYPPPDVVASIKDIQGDLITSQQAAMAWMNSNQFVAVSNAAKRKLKLAPYPKISADGLSGMSIRSSQAFSVSATSKFKTEAAKFISFFVNDLEANAILNGERGVPISSTVRDSLKANADENNKAIFEYIDLVGSIASHQQPIEPSGQIEIEDVAKRVSEELAFNQIDPADAAKEFFNGATEIMEKAKAAS